MMMLKLNISWFFLLLTVLSFWVILFIICIDQVFCFPLSIYISLFSSCGNLIVGKPFLVSFSIAVFGGACDLLKTIAKD